MGIFSKKTKITPSEFATVLHNSIQSSTFKFMDDASMLAEIGIDDVNENISYLEMLIYHCFCFIEVFYRSQYENIIKNAILDGMHSILYTSFRKNCNYSEEMINDLKDVFSERYNGYSKCMESENWLREMSKQVLTNIRDGNEMHGEMEIYTMTSYTAEIYKNLPELLNKYTLIVK